MEYRCPIKEIKLALQACDPSLWSFLIQGLSA